MDKKKSSSSHFVLRPSEEIEHGIEDLAEVITENLVREDNKLQMEPFEVYAQRVRFHIHASVDEFHTRFMHGYELLLEEIGKNLESYE